jgi:hypothetical protein
LHRVRAFFAASIVCTLLASTAFAVECGGWFQHLAQDHNVWLLKEQNPPLRNSAFKYESVPKSKYVVALPLDQMPGWKTKFSADGLRVDISNSHFGYVIEHDRNGECLNTSGYSAELGGNKTFNYDWKVCEALLSKFRDRRGPLEMAQKSFPTAKSATDDERFANIRKRSSAVQAALDTMLKTPSQLQQNEIQRMLSTSFKHQGLAGQPDIGTIYQTCEGQTSLIEEVRKSTGNFVSPATRK